VANVVNVNISAIMSQGLPLSNEVFDIACVSTTSLLRLWEMISELCGSTFHPTFGPLRPGDIMSSLADLQKAKDMLPYSPETDLINELRKTIQWYRENDSGQYFS